MPFRGNSWRQAKIMCGPNRGSLAACRSRRTEAAEIGAVEHQADVIGRRAGPQGVLPAVLRNRGQRAGVAQGPAQDGPNVPPGREIVSLLRIHVHVAAMHRDDAGNPELARSQTAAGPVGMAQWAWTTSAPDLARLGQDGPVLASEVAGHDRQPGEFPQPAHLALGHPAVGQVGRQIEREANDPHPIEHVLPGQRRPPGVTTVTECPRRTRWRLMSWT